jgi:hypothetical protein
MRYVSVSAFVKVVFLSTLAAGALVLAFNFHAVALTTGQALSAPFTLKILNPRPEAPFALRFFNTAVKTDSRGRVITGPNSDPVKNIVGAESAGERGGLQRYTKIMFEADYFTGRPGHRVDPNNPGASSGNAYWPNRKQPFRSWPNALALSPNGAKLYVTLPGREGYPDWRVAVVDTARRSVLRWIDLRPSGQTLGTRPIAVESATIGGKPYVVVLNEFANFGTVIDAATDAFVGQFETGFYAEGLLFNTAGTRLYVTDRFNDAVKVFKVDPGPFFTLMATVPTGTTDLDRTNPRNLALSADGTKLYVANTLGHTIAVVNVAGDANVLVATLPVGGLAGQGCERQRDS